MGKKARRNAVSTAGMSPMPNHITSNGTTAALGMLLKPTRSGYTASFTVADAPMAKPSKRPSTTAAPKPMSVVMRVWRA